MQKTLHLSSNALREPQSSLMLGCYALAFLGTL